MLESRVLDALSGQEDFARLLLRIRAKGITDGVVFSALERTPRGGFVAPHDAHLAYSNRVLPIACGEYIERLDEQIAILVALTLESKHRVLEVGTGSGFTAAVMARLVGRLTTIERYQTLYDGARGRFQELGIDNIILHRGDARDMLAQLGSFDRIILWPAMEEVPHQFIDMLAGNGMLICPIGGREEAQTLVRYVKVGSRLNCHNLFTVRYQPMLEGASKIL